MSKFPLDPDLAPDPDKRYRAPRQHEDAYTLTELRVVVYGLCACQGLADHSKAVRGLCTGLGRPPKFAPGAHPTLKQVTDRADGLLSRRLWKTLTGYGGERLGRPPDAGLRDPLPLTWGEKQIIRQAALGQNKFLELLDMAWVLGRKDPDPVRRFCSLSREVDEEGPPAITSEQDFTEAAREAASHPPEDTVKALRVFYSRIGIWTTRPPQSPSTRGLSTSGTSTGRTSRRR